MQKLNDFVPPVDTAAIWRALCEDSGASVVVADRDGRILYASRGAARWLRWHRQELTGVADESALMLEDACPPSLLGERLELGRRVCDQGKPIRYESVYRGMRFCVTMRPVPIGDGTHHLVAVSRRLKPWERPSRDDDGDAECVELRHHDPGPLAELSVRELEVLILIGEGLSYAEIAERLHRSVRTIERHRDRLGHKLGCSNRVQLARFAIRAGLCELPTPPEAEELRGAGFDPLDVSPPIRQVTARRSRGPG